MSFRVSAIFILLLTCAIPAFAHTTVSVETNLSEIHPVVVAIDHDQAETLKAWLSAGNNPLAKINNKLHEQLIERAATHAATASFEVLLRAVHESHQDEALKDSRGTPLLVTLSELAVPGKSSTSTYEKMISLFLEISPRSAQAKDHAYIGDGRTALHQAAAVGNLKVAEMLIMRGAPVNAKNSSGECPLHLAARFGHLELAKLLIDSGAEINVKSKFTQSTPLMAAAEMGHENIIRMLMISGAQKDEKDAFGKTAPDRFREYRVASLSASTHKRQN